MAQTTPMQKLMRTSARQHQVFTTAQAVDCGVSATTLRSLAPRIGIVDLGYGMWAGAASPNTYQRKLWVAKLSMSSDVLFTGRTVLWLRRIISAIPQEIDILIGPSLHLRPRARTRLFRGSIPEENSVNLEGMPTVGVYRAFTDAAAVVPVESLVRWLPAMDRLRQGSLDGLEEYAVKRGRFVGVVNLRAAIAVLRVDLPHSTGERVGRKALRAAGIPPYPRPYPVRQAGRTLAEIDLAYPKVLYGAEVDGPHHLLREVAIADRARDRQLGRLGWTIDRFPYEHVINDPAGFAREVQRGLDGAKARNLVLSNR